MNPKHWHLRYKPRFNWYYEESDLGEDDEDDLDWFESLTDLWASEVNR
jgi:hypothetical protein